LQEPVHDLSDIPIIVLAACRTWDDLAAKAADRCSVTDFL